MKKASLRVICALLLCAMLPVGALACGQADDSDAKQTSAPTTTSTNGDSADTTDNGLDAKGFVRDNLPADLNFNQETITFLTWSDVEHEEFSVESLTGETVNDAIYNRNQTVEDRLGVKLNFNGIPGNGDNVGSFTKYVGNAIQAGSHDLDICASYSLSVAAVAAQGYLLNLLDLPYLDFEQPWWPERLTTEATINDKLFFS